MKKRRRHVDRRYLEELRKTRNIELCNPRPDGTFLELLDELLENNNDTAREFEEFLDEPELCEREKEAQFIIRQLKVFYKARGAEVYEREGENCLMMHYPGKKCWTRISTCGEHSMVTLKVILPILATHGGSRHLAHALHSFNEDPDVGFGFFCLDDCTGEISCIYRYSFAEGSFTEKLFHRYFRSVMKSAEAYLETIRLLTV